MSQHVVIKHNRYGIELVLDSTISFEELLISVADKFEASSSFFKDAKLAIAFKGRELSEEEVMAIVDTISEKTSIEIVSIIENGTALEELMKQQVEAAMEQPVEAEVQKIQELPETYMQYMPEGSIVSDFYVGTLRSGQVLECASSVTLIGDVNPGAKIISEGNVVILGALKGNASAGVTGNDNCFIFALDMQPIQLQIGHYYAKSPDKEVEKKKFGRRVKKPVQGYHPTIATVKEENIYIEPMTKGCLDSL